MKKSFLIITCTLLFLVGCGTDKTANTPNVESSEPTQTTEYDNEYYYELIPEFSLEIQGLQWDFSNLGFSSSPNTFYFNMLEPSNIQIEDDTITATGVLSDEYHATEEAVSVVYKIQDGYIKSAKLVTEEVLILTPIVPFSMDIVYDSIERISFFYGWGEDNNNIVTYDKNVYTLELFEDDWDDNYTYMGSVTVTDADGNIYQTFNDIHITYVENYNDVYSWAVNPGQSNASLLAVSPIE